jgi:hypothetical protein
VAWQARQIDLRNFCACRSVFVTKAAHRLPGPKQPGQQCAAASASNQGR